MEPSSNLSSEPLSWSAKPARQLLKLAWPMAVSMLSLSAMTLADTMFVGWLGAPSLAGVGLAGTTIFLALCFPLGLMSGAKVLVSQRVGAGRRNETGSVLATAVLLALAFGLVISLVGWGLGHHVGLFASTSQAAHSARAYLLVRVLSAPVFLAGVALRETRYGLGDSRSPMVASVVANVLHIALDYVFIFPLGLGVAGAALATVVSQFVESSLMLYAHVRDPETTGTKTVSLQSVRDLWRVGWPSGVQWALEMGAFSTLTLMISKYDQTQMAAHQIVLQVLHFSFLPAIALHSAAAVLTGQSVGGKRYDLVTVVARKGLWIAGTYMGLFAIAMSLLGSWAIRAFTADPQVVDVALGLVRVAIVFQLFDAANIVARGALQGTGDVRFPAMVGVMASWLSTPPLMWWLGYHHQLGALGGWIGLCAEITVGSIILWWRLERRGWMRAALARTAHPENLALQSS